MSGPGTPAKSGVKTPSSTPTKPHVKGHIEGHLKQNTQTKNPREDFHYGQNKTVVTTKETQKIAGIPIGSTEKVVTTETSGNNGNSYSGTVDTQTEMYLGGRVDFDNGGGPSTKAGTGTLHPTKLPKKAPARKASVVLPAKDAIVITTAMDENQIRNGDTADDAEKDARMVFAAAQRLRKQLDRGGVLGDSAKADLGIKGLENIDALAVAFQRDYTSEQEQKIILEYTDHRHRSFDAAVGEISVSHAGAMRLAAAFDKAAEAVANLKSAEVSPTGTVAQEDITSTVRRTLKKELSLTP